MNTTALANALRAIGQGLYEAADVLLEAASAPVVTRSVSGAPGAVTASTADADDLFPPFAPEEPDYEPLPLPADAPALGRCPFHGKPWTVRPAGVSKAGKPYNAFYKCDGKEADGTFCQRKPTKAWADAHPIAA